jgi:hypothetical protein
MKKLLTIAAISILSLGQNAEAQNNKPKSTRQMLEASLIASLPTKNDDTASVMPPQTDYTYLITLLPVKNDDFEVQNPASVVKIENLPVIKATESLPAIIKTVNN